MYGILDGNAVCVYISLDAQALLHWMQADGDDNWRHTMNAWCRCDFVTGNDRTIDPVEAGSTDTLALWSDRRDPRRVPVDA